ncbi:MAG TPA: GNAT family N-acetyltransferase [Pseudonocardiaceae bacterium]
MATASFMVTSDARGRGVGAVLCRYALDWARSWGYAGMPFNAVVETNHAAVNLYGVSVSGSSAPCRERSTTRSSAGWACT